jgi:PIN domain
MKPRIYIETSVIGYLAARPSTDAINAARQYQSMQLWLARERFDLLVSDLVIDESREGDAQAVARRLVFAGQLNCLAVPDEAQAIAEALVTSGAMPSIAFADGVHIACAALSGVDVIASWNFRHIASVWARRKIQDCLVTLGVPVPSIATPEEIMESPS